MRTFDPHFFAEKSRIALRRESSGFQMEEYGVK